MSLRSSPNQIVRLVSITTALYIAVALQALGCERTFPVSHWQPADSMPVRGISAHRGAADTHPENTIAALREAVSLGAAQIELDIRGTADGKLVVIHDSTVDRTTNGTGKIKHMSLAEIRTLDAGTWKDASFKGERVPTFREALDVLPRDRWLNINTKDDPWVAVAAMKVLEEEGRLGQSFLATDEASVRAAVKAVPGAAFCFLDRKRNRESYIRASIRAGAQFIQLHRRRGVPKRSDIKRLHDAGLRVNYCCTDDVAAAERLHELGVDFPLVDSFR